MQSHHYTGQLIAVLQHAYDRLNQTLFGGQLPSCILTLRGGNGRYGYYSAARFTNLQGQMVDEIALNAGFFALRSVEQVMSTLAHEMVHQWQHHYGTPGKHGHHNREWVDKMREIGLQPSATGMPDGKTTGTRVSHYMLPDGAFCQHMHTLMDEGFALPWLDRHAPTAPEAATAHYQAMQALAEQGVAYVGSIPPVMLSGTDPAMPRSGAEEPALPPPLVIPPAPRRVEPNPRVKFVCPCCQLKAWARDDAELHCGHCDEMMIVTAAPPSA